MLWRSKREPVRATREITITSKHGFHARPAADFARCANSFRSEIVLVKDGVRFPATSVIDLLRANLTNGTVATLEANGVDATEAVERLAQLLQAMATQE